MPDEKLKQLKKMALLEESPALAIFDELTEIQTIFKDLIQAVQSKEEIKVSNFPPAVDLEPINQSIIENFEKLKLGIENLSVNIKEIKEVDLSGVERLLKAVVDKQIVIEKPDLNELNNISSILENVLLAIQNIKLNDSDLEVEHLSGIHEVLKILNDNLVKTELDYEKLAKVIKDNVSIVVGGGGSGTVRNKSEQLINPATEEKQDAIVSSIQQNNTIRFDEQTIYTYIGFAVPGTPNSAALWMIKRITNADTTVVFADGNSNADNIWDNRTSIPYS